MFRVHRFGTLLIVSEFYCISVQRVRELRIWLHVSYISLDNLNTHAFFKAPIKMSLNAEYRLNVN